MTITEICLFIVIFTCNAVMLCFGADTELPVHSMYLKQCSVWQNISDSLEKEPNVDLKCMKNSECSGVDCIGKYVYEGILSSLLGFEKEFCIGLVVEACSKPTNIHMYIVMFSADGNNTQETDIIVTGDKNVPIKGAGFNMMGSVARGFIDIKMHHTEINGQPHIYLSARLRVKLFSHIFGEEFSRYLSGFDVAIVHAMNIPVPRCDPHVGNHTHRPGLCNWSTVSHLQRQGPMTKCNNDSMDNCGNFEMCENSQCVCMPNHIFNNKTQSCTPEVVIDFDLPVDDQGRQSVQMSKKYVIIIPCSIAAFIVLLAVAATVALRYRRHRARYTQHELLRQEDDDDDPEVA